jgi:hypothetical protein
LLTKLTIRNFKRFGKVEASRDRTSRWWADVKASDDFLDPVFEAFFQKLRLPNLMRKTGYHELARQSRARRGH